MWGSDQEISDQLRGVHEAWHQTQKPALITYANHHPQREMRTLADDLAERFQQALINTGICIDNRRGEGVPEWLEAARTSKDEAARAAERILAAIRAY